MKVSVIGCGLRTPLLIHGLARSGLRIDSLSLYDTDPSRARLMALIAPPLANGHNLPAHPASSLEECIDGASFVVSSIRPGGIESRARDERIVLDLGFAGQETTGPAGLAMALRTIPVSLAHARIVEKRAPNAWLLNFTNPAGIVTQALANYSGARVVGICDTPAEIFFRIALALCTSPNHIECDYFGLNHLGFVQSVRLKGTDIIDVLLQDDALLRRLYPAELFPPALIRAIRLIPTEYLFFYFNQFLALQNQRTAGATRGEELLRLNRSLLDDMHRLAHHDPQAALNLYRAYLNRRNASYLRLEATAESAFQQPDLDWNPFEGETGYHRIAVDTMLALSNPQPSRIVLNVLNQGAIPDLQPSDSIEVPCLVDAFGPQPVAVGPLPEPVRGLIISVKTSERYLIRAAIEHSSELALLAFLTNPIIGDWFHASALLNTLIDSDPDHLGYLSPFARTATALHVQGQ